MGVTMAAVRHAARFRLTTAFLLGSVCGCATSLSGFQPAHVGPRGQVRVEIGEDVSIPTGAIASTIDAGKALVALARDRMLTENEKIQLFGAGVNVGLNPPGFVEHIGASYNFADRWELSLRYAGGGGRIASRYQIRAQETDGFDLSVGLGVARTSTSFPIDEVLDIIEVDGFERWQIDLPALVGWHNDFFRFWMGPRLSLTSYSAALVLHGQSAPGAEPSRDVARVEGSGTFIGVQLGGAVGYRWVFLAIELTTTRFGGHAELDVFGRRASADTSSWVFQPGIGLMGEF